MFLSELSQFLIKLVYCDFLTVPPIDLVSEPTANLITFVTDGGHIIIETETVSINDP